MGEETAIEWADDTFNIAWGCTKVSPACTHCYAETWAKRHGVGWGATAERRTFGEKHWNAPRKWNRKAEASGVRRRVFCSSMCDVFEDHPVIDQEREKLWALIRETPWLDWLLLTKRAERIAANLPADWGAGYPNVWLGVTAENQEWADKRIPLLLSVPAAVRFVSYEPALGAVDWSRYLPSGPWFLMRCEHCGWTGSSERVFDERYARAADVVCPSCKAITLADEIDGIHWVIAGGESGTKARPAHPQWFRDVRDQCAAAGVAFFFKQWGEWVPDSHVTCDMSGMRCVKIGDKDETFAFRVGKKDAGRVLDGRTWDESPAVGGISAAPQPGWGVPCLRHFDWGWR